MGIPFSCYVMMLPKPLLFFLLLLDCFSFSFSYVLRLLGLRPYPYATVVPPWDDYALYLRATSPEPANLLPLPATASAATDTLRAVPFEILSKKTAASAADEHAVCAVCFEEFAVGHTVRELGNCDHAFHAACIDRWAETGSATCPLCRSALQPTSPQRRWKQPAGGVWFRR